MIMEQTACGKPHRKCRIKSLAEFGKAKPGTVVNADICPKSGLYVASRELGYDDAGAWKIPSKLAVVVE